ncbi:hypothetical protein Tco_1123023 [Tanacetum coccineum]|uniref:Integrase, catalytic region, zinc finger, CCHC-type, peptidase aspartic, catalytic n=1 Tax=Tanacetum coccineum TaxID=301880 RepID=A0ABQ5J274_9ASTR
MELYMQNKEHGRMILESVKHGLLIWPTIEENEVTRTKKYVELSATEKIQADCDLKETNIILQGLPYDIYSLVNHHRVAKDLWERIQLLILPPEWSKFVTDVKLAKDLHTTNFDQLHAYLQQDELHANEVRIMLQPRTNRLSTIFHHLSHKLSNELLLFVKLYSGDIISRNVLTLRIPSPFVIVIVVMVAVVGSWSGPSLYNLIH